MSDPSDNGTMPPATAPPEPPEELLEPLEPDELLLDPDEPLDPLDPDEPLLPLEPPLPPLEPPLAPGPWPPLPRWCGPVSRGGTARRRCRSPSPCSWSASRTSGACTAAI